MTQQLTIENKQEIQTNLTEYVKRYPSQTKAANSLAETSLGTINAILNGKFDNISDAMFLNIRSQITASRVDGGWQLCKTAAFQDMETLMQDAQAYQNVSWIVGPAGIGKTTAAAIYAGAHRNVFMLPCSEDMHKADFVRELARKIGIRTDGLTVRETMTAIMSELVTKERPLLIFDEGDKLTDSVFYYFITLYNALEDKCGMLFLSTPYIKRRIERGLQNEKKGYDEMHSRICRRFVELTPVSEYEVTAVCRANGLSNEGDIKAVIKDSRDCRYDMRRVKKAVHKQRRIAAASKL